MCVSLVEWASRGMRRAHVTSKSGHGTERETESDEVSSDGGPGFGEPHQSFHEFTRLSADALSGRDQISWLAHIYYFTGFPAPLCWLAGTYFGLSWRGVVGGFKIMEFQ
jgi:hypothetical protein